MPGPLGFFGLGLSKAPNKDRGVRTTSCDDTLIDTSPDSILGAVFLNYLELGVGMNDFVTESSPSEFSYEPEDVLQTLQWLKDSKHFTSDFRELCSTRNTSKVGDANRQKKLVLKMFMAATDRYLALKPNDPEPEGNLFTTLKLISMCLVGLFTDQVCVLNICCDILLAVRQSIDSAAPITPPGSQELLGQEDEDAFLGALCGLKMVQSHGGHSPDICLPLANWYNPDLDRIPREDSGAMMHNIQDKLQDLLEPATNPWADINSPAIEALEQQSRTVMVFGEPLDGVIQIIRYVLKRRRTHHQKMSILVLYDGSEQSQSYATMTRECLELCIHKNKVDASVVMVPLSAIGCLIDIVDRIIIGVKTCFSDGSALSYLGTQMVCDMAKAHNKTVIVVTTLHRVAHFDSHSELQIGILPNEELVSGRDFSFFVTPVGMFPPSALKHEVERNIHVKDRDLLKLFLRLKSEKNSTFKKLVADGILSPESHGTPASVYPLM